MKILENLWQSSDIFGKVGKRSKMALKFSENFRKCSKIIGNFPDVIVNVTNSSLELKKFQWSWFLRSPQKDPSKL